MSSDNPSTPLERGMPHTAVTFLCPSCELALDYIGSRSSKADEGDQHSPLDLNDYFRCPAGCGTFEHERRTHRMRQLDANEAAGL